MCICKNIWLYIKIKRFGCVGKVRLTYAPKVGEMRVGEMRGRRSEKNPRQLATRQIDHFHPENFNEKY